MKIVDNDLPSLGEQATGQRPSIAAVSAEIANRFAAVADQLAAKGYKSVSIDIYISSYNIFEVKPPLKDPIRGLSFSANIRCGSPHNHVKEWSFASVEAALEGLEKTAQEMPTQQSLAAAKSNALAKLTPEELQLVRCE